MKQYWLTLNPDTFLWVKQGKGYIYNTINHRIVTFSNEGILKKIVNELLNIDNLYRISLDEDTVKHPDVSSFVHNILETESGTFTQNNEYNRRPISLKPVLKIQDNIDYFKWEHKLNIDGDIIHNLHQLIFYINGSNSGNNEYFKQTFFPTITKNVLDKEKICWFAFNARKSSFLFEISLVGNIWTYPDADILLQKLKKMNYHVIVYVTEKDVLANLEKANQYVNQELLHILVTDTNMAESLPKDEIWRKDTLYTFLVASEQSYETAEKCIKKHNLKKAIIHPTYTGDNISFFEENLFITEEDIANTSLSKREIFAHQSLNINNFGKLFILPDEKVHANVNNPPIGNISDPPHDMVYKEMTEGRSWLQIRNEKPCCDCIYQWLCPSPSNFEFVFKKSNLCHIKQ